MYYYKLDRKTIAKYEVIFEEKKLLRLKEKIITEDCEVVSDKLQASFFTLSSKDPYYEIRNIKNKGYLFTRENGGGIDTNIYLFTYDKYIYTQEVLFINRLLENDPTVIDDIYVCSKNQQEKINQEIHQKNAEIEAISNYNSIKKIELLKELNDLLELATKEPNPNLIKLQKLIKLNLIAEKNINNIQDFANFLETEINVNSLNRRKIKNK